MPKCDSAVQVELLKLCAGEGIPIVADEVYQENVWAAGKSFTSFRKVRCALYSRLCATLSNCTKRTAGCSVGCAHLHCMCYVQSDLRLDAELA